MPNKVRILYPRYAQFSFNSGRKKKETLGNTMKTSAAIGSVGGVISGGVKGYQQAKQYLASPRFRKFVLNKASNNQLKKGQLSLMRNTAKAIGTASGAVKGGAKYALAGAGLGAAVYGLNKLLTRNRKGR